jgi:hypothetical protein
MSEHASGSIPHQTAPHIAPSGRVVAMKTCPICGTKAFLATRRCKADCGWSFTEKTIDRADGGSAARQVQERKRNHKPLAPVVTKQGALTTHTNIDPEDDGNLDTCVVCGDMGTLICCDMCPLSFHADCAGLEKIPQGFWSCPQCTQRNLSASVLAQAHAQNAAASGAAGAAEGGQAAGAAGQARAGAQGPMVPLQPIGIQAGLDPFHQKLNLCLDYTSAQMYECDGYHFQCFTEPDFNLVSTDPTKLAAAQAAQQARVDAKNARDKQAEAEEQEAMRQGGEEEDTPMKTEA